MDNKVIRQFAVKLGISGDTVIIDKSTELLRLVDLKAGSSLQQLGGYARTVLCLDLATSLQGHEFDAATALKLAGLKKPSYLNYRRILEKLLDINKPIGVAEICVHLNLIEIQAACLSLLDKYANSRENNLRNIDTKHPQYAAMAVAQMCRLRKIKVPKSKLIGFSHLKPAQWALLEKSWDTWLLENGDEILELLPNKNRSRGLTNGTETDHTNGLAGKQPPDVLLAANVIEDYEAWRERILKKAFEDIEMQRECVALNT